MDRTGYAYGYNLTCLQQYNNGSAGIRIKKTKEVLMHPVILSDIHGNPLALDKGHLL